MKKTIMSNNCGRIIPFLLFGKNSFVYETALCFLFFVLLGFYVLTTATPNVL